MLALALALANNAAFNLEENLLGTLNAQDNILSLVKNGTLAGFRPNYSITVESSALGKVADYSARILGFTLPRSFLSDAGSIFLSENNTTNIERANAMILNTGKGQVQALIANMTANINGTTQNDNPNSTVFRSGYVPGFLDNTGKKAINPNIYAFYFNHETGSVINFLTESGVIPLISYKREELIKDYGFDDFSDHYLDTYTTSNIKKPTFSWGSDVGGRVNSVPEYYPYVGDKKSILSKTQALFDDAGMKTIVSSKGQMGVQPSQIQTAVVGYGISRGSAVMSSGNFDLSTGLYNGTSAGTADNTYCRSWTTTSRYSNMNNLVRGKGLSGNVPYRQQINGSVLDDNGHPIIAPYYDSNNPNGAPADPKRFMFSIENLAWCDNLQDLLQSETGTGDLISGKKGRIMWFPPYDISFNENTSASWESNNFIGRGEPLYTYNNTERSGTISFKVIVDHPTYVNSFKGSKGPDDHYIASFFAGCIEPSSTIASKLTISELDSISRDYTTSQQKTDTEQTPPESNNIYVYFPNDVSDMTNYTTYEVGPTSLTVGIGSVVGQVTHPGKTINDTSDFSLNAQNITIDGTTYDGFFDVNMLPALNTYLNNKCSKCKITITGYASPQGDAASNTTLANDRANWLLNYIKPNLFTTISGVDKDSRFSAKGDGVVSGSKCTGTDDASTSTKFCKLDRYAIINIAYGATLSPNTNAPDPMVKPSLSQQQTLSIKIINRFYDERNFFEKLQATDSFIFDSIREKIRYFHPAFHSTTPEGLNSRLTFLNQCMRQGPTLEQQGANNLAFGRPPVCILRIGDFYNTKIIIDSLSVDYEPLVWDLNPEGIGVQPMIANVNMSIKFIGGSSLSGPINKLQNALSFNYYANTQVYDVRADYIAKNPLTNTLVANPSNTSAYVVQNDFNPLTYGTTVETSVMSQDQIKSNTPTVDQILGNNNTTGPTSAPIATPPSENEIDNIKLTRTDSTDNGIELFFETNVISTEINYRVKITDNITTVEIGIGKLTVTTIPSTQTKEFTGFIDGLIDGKTYFVIILLNDGIRKITSTFNFIE